MREGLDSLGHRLREMGILESHSLHSYFTVAMHIQTLRVF